MKKFISKGLSILTIFTMVFMSNMALAQAPEQITFCHVPPGNEGNPQTITTSINAWENAHDSGTGTHSQDYLGPCEGDDDEDDEGDEENCDQDDIVNQENCDDNDDCDEGDDIIEVDNEDCDDDEDEDCNQDDIVGNENEDCDDDNDQDDEEVTIVAEKIICEEESMLPNWGAGASNITETTASDWVAEHEGCYVAKGWNFEWAYYNTANPGDNTIGETGGAWTAFNTTTTIPMPVETDDDTKLWVREIFPSEDYIPFTGANTDQNVSAELYCHTDVLNYDNYERIDDIEEGGTYNCVAWNVQTDDNEEESCPEGNLIENGGFENPDVASGNWTIYDDGTPGLGWDVQWNGAFVDAPETAKLEIHDSLWTPVAQGSQYAELDTDWGYNDGEQASVIISQEIETISGQTYVLSYDFSPRPGTGAGDNMLEVLVNGSSVDTHSADGSLNSGNSWTHYEVEFTATGETTTIAFKDTGTPNSLGTLLDNVSVNCGDDEPEEEDEPSCDSEEIWARVVITDFGNEEDGNVTDTIYLGSDSNTVASGEWFKVSDLDAASLDDFADVPGVAVKRDAGKIVLELHGSQDVPDREFIDGYIEFFNGKPTLQTPATIQNKLESNDSVWMNNDKSYFDLQVNTGDDRFTTDYVYSIDESCQDQNPSCDSQTIWARVIINNYSNEGAGDVTNTIYLGSDSNTVASGEWFDTSILDYVSIEDFADVPGLAVKRKAGQLVLELHGSHNPQGTGQEYVDGYIEFWNGVPTDVVGATGQNKLENDGAEIGHPDSVWILGDKAYFDLGVGTADDRFTTTYVYEQEDCNDDDTPSCEETQSCEDDEDDDCIEDCDEDDDTPDECTENCEEDNDNDEPESFSGGSSSSGGSSRRSGGGGSGEVLGAQTEALCSFGIDTYMRFGYQNNPEQVKILQWLLNKYVAPVPAIVVDGYFGASTEAAVKAFQLKYKDTILTPWNLVTPTGIFFRTTLNQAKNLECPEMILPVPKNLLNWSLSGGLVPKKAN